MIGQAGTIQKIDKGFVLAWSIVGIFLLLPLIVPGDISFKEVWAVIPFIWYLGIIILWVRRNKINKYLLSRRHLETKKWKEMKEEERNGIFKKELRNLKIILIFATIFLFLFIIWIFLIS